MALKLKAGTKLQLEIIPTEYGLQLRTSLVVGKRTKTKIGKPVNVRTEEELLMELEAWAQRQLARIGLEKIK